MLTYTPCRLILGFHFPEVHSRSLRELKIFDWSCFRRSWTSQVSRWTSFWFWWTLLLCRSSYEPSDFIKWPPTSCVPTSDENSMETAERLKMTVWREFWSRAFSCFSIVDPCTVHCPNRKQTHWTQLSLQSNTVIRTRRQRVSNVSQACQGCPCRFWRSRRCRLCIWNRLWCVSLASLAASGYTVSPWLPEKLNH